MGINCHKARAIRGGSLLFSTKFLDIPGTHFTDLGRMKGRPWSYPVVTNFVTCFSNRSL